MHSNVSKHNLMHRCIQIWSKLRHSLLNGVQDQLELYVQQLGAAMLPEVLSWFWCYLDCFVILVGFLLANCKFIVICLLCCQCAWVQFLHICRAAVQFLAHCFGKLFFHAFLCRTLTSLLSLAPSWCHCLHQQLAKNRTPNVGDGHAHCFVVLQIEYQY